MFLIGALLGAIMGISGLIVLLSVTGVSILQFLCLVISLNQLVLLISLASLKSYCRMKAPPATKVDGMKSYLNQ